MNDSEKMVNLCRTAGVLTARQRDRLLKLLSFLPFLADLSMSCVELSARDEEDRLIILAEFAPQTAYLPQEVFCGAGSIFSRQEKLLAARTIEQARPFSGRQEWSIGHFLPLETLPLFWEKRAYAALSFIFSGDEKDQRRVFGSVLSAALASFHTLLPAFYARLEKDEGVIIASREQRIIYANFTARHLCKMMGIENLFGLRLFDKKFRNPLLKEVRRHDEPSRRELYFQGGMVLSWQQFSLSEAGNEQFFIVRLKDLTFLREQEKKEQIQATVLKETHHRVKNNLQLVAGLLRLQARRSADEKVKMALGKSVERIYSIASSHALLLENGGNLKTDELVERLSFYAAQAFLPEDFELNLLTTSTDLGNLAAGSLSLALNELMTNSMRHGFWGQKKGTIAFSAQWRGDICYFEYYDDGCGLKESLDKKKSLGMSLIRTLIVDDLGGKISMVGNNGIHVYMAIPRKKGDDNARAHCR